MAGKTGNTNPLDTLRNDLSADRRPYYLFHGENHWQIREALGLLKTALVPKSDGDFSYEERRVERKGDWLDIEASLREYSFFGGIKLIHLEVPESLDEDTRAALSRFLEETPGQNVLCISAPNLTQLMAAKNRIQKQKGLILKFENLKGAALIAWTRDQLKSKGLACDKDVPVMLTDILGDDQGEIAGEISKLELLYGPRGKPERISTDILRRILDREKTEDIWVLASELRPGNEAGAMKCLSGILDSGNQNLIAMVGALTYSITILLRARLLLDSGLPPARVASALPTWGSRAREYVAQAGTMSRRHLLAWVFNLQKLDHKLKSSGHDRKRELVEITFLESMAGRYLPSD
ncbi:MAG: DNA polymerase III subunit delta [bacterium]|nr:DNA polymerase III subunit delta [bacterium]